MSLGSEFDRCWPWLQAGLEYYALRRPDGTLWLTHEKRHVWQRIQEGRTLFWPGKRSATLTEILTSPTGLRTHSSWLSGGVKGEALDELAEMQKSIEEWGRQQECHRHMGNGREGWLRIFEGYQAIGVRKEKSLL